MPFYKKIYFLGVLFFVINAGLAQTHQSKGIVEIDKALNDENYGKAETVLLAVTNEYYATRKADSLVNYIFYVGKLEQAKSNSDQAVIRVEAYIQKIKTLAPAAVTMRQVYIDAGEYYGFAGKNKAAYKANEEALKYTQKMQGLQPQQLAKIENNLSAYAQRSGDLKLAGYHGKKALELLLKDKNVDFETLYITYNAMGTNMWYISKIDSALYYFTKALEALNRTTRTPVNEYYRPAIVQNNLSALYGVQGKTTKAIEALQSTITNLKMFMATKEPNPKKSAAINFQFEATDNLAGIYKELGNLKQAQALLEYSYSEKQKNLQPNDPGIFISQILLGQLYFATKDFEKSLQYLNNGLAMISKADGDYLFWQADASNALALLYDEQKNTKQAAVYFEKADSLYEESLQGEYDDTYLDFLRNAALFYAENGDTKTAILKANKGYNYVVKTQGAETLTTFYQLMNVADVYLKAGKYKDALGYSNKGLLVVNKNIQASANLLDSIKAELKKPKAILLKAKAEYELLAEKNIENLTALLQQVNEALAVLERRKTLLDDEENINLVMADNAELLDFAKQLTFELYGLTNDKAYIDRMMSLQESGLYSRIRARLDKNDSLQFAHVPANTQAKERQLKAAITASLHGDATHNDKMAQYFNAVGNWNQFQQKLKVDYPQYYQMRYASIFKSLAEVTQAIPANTTVIRYFFINKKLYAFVADKARKQVYALDDSGLQDAVKALSEFKKNVSETGDILVKLYGQLWAPLLKSIQYKKVVIIPDGILYNLSFDMFTQSKIVSYKELATKSLLANYSISYQYSLFLLNNKNTANYKDNFIAFAPGFSDKIKNDYRAALQDSLKVDNSYLSLLPQPFTIDVAIRSHDLLGGNAFLNELSTERSFKANAGNHQIIHIGTHAESNDVHPEFSRLIFAKNVLSKDEDNSLFVDEIYGCNLASHLTVLTACESGKPGYQDGEGMISLAHAFNYAGSESILTGLWKIDEQASALLMDFFYKNMLNGMPKDEALRHAKLSYLQQAEGRMLAPQYWAGLVIMGDTEPLVLVKQTSYLPSTIGGVIALLIGLSIYVYKKKAKKFQA